MKTDTTVLINEAIVSKRVNLIGEEGERLGEFKTEDAIQMAYDRSLDLVEVGCSDGTSTCRIMDHSKWLYQKKKRQKNSSSQNSKLKQLVLSPRTEEHDLMVLVNKAKSILSDGDKVKFMIQFKGREMAHTSLGFRQMDFILSALSDEAVIESEPRLLGNVLSMQVTSSK